MQDNNPIDDAAFDALLKEHNIQPQTDTSAAWSDFDFGPEQKPASFMDSLTGKAPDTNPDVTSAMGGGEFGQNIASHVSEAVKHPLETAKGIIKGVPGAAADITKLIDTGISKVTGQDGTMLDYGPIEELTAPSNTAQETGSFIGSMLPVERGLTASKPLVEMGTKYLEKKGAEKSVDFIKDLITPELNATKTAQAIRTGKVTEGGLLKDRDITETVPFFKEIQNAVSEVPGISKGKTLLENSNAIHDHIGTIAEDLVKQLKSSGENMKISNIAEVPAKFSQYMESVKTSLKENPTIVGDAEKTATKILNKFESLVKEEGSTPDAILSARKKLDNWMSSQKGENIFDPKTEGAVSVALRAIRQGGNDFIAGMSKDVKVKDMLAKQTSLYDAIDNIAPKAAKEGANGLKRWVKAHPTLVKTAKNLGYVGMGAAGLGGINKLTGE